MANIQSSVNQMISLAGLLASQNPALQAASAKKTKLNDIKQKEAILEKQKGVLPDKEVKAKQVKLAKEKLDIDPTDENYKTYLELNKPEMRETPEDTAREAYEYEKEVSEGTREGKAITEEEYINPNETTSEVYEAEVNRYLEGFKMADKSLADKAAAQRETKRRILEGTPSEYLLERGDI
jgi:hypothetical protein